MYCVLTYFKIHAFCGNSYVHCSHRAKLCKHHFLVGVYFEYQINTECALHASLVISQLGRNIIVQQIQRLNLKIFTLQKCVKWFLLCHWVKIYFFNCFQCRYNRTMKLLSNNRCSLNTASGFPHFILSSSSLQRYKSLLPLFSQSTYFPWSSQALVYSHQSYHRCTARLSQLLNNDVPGHIYTDIQLFSFENFYSNETLSYAHAFNAVPTDCFYFTVLQMFF